VSASASAGHHECFYCKTSINYGENVGGKVYSKPSDKWLDHYVCVSCYGIIWDLIEKRGKKL